MIKPWKIIQIKESDAGRFVEYECKRNRTREDGVFVRETLVSGFWLDEGEDPETAVEDVLVQTGWVNG